MKLLLLCLLISGPCFALDSLEIAGKKYELQLNEVQCVNGAADLFDPVGRAVHDRMSQARCDIQAGLDSSIDCSRVDQNFLLRDFISTELRKKNYCNCRQGPAECAVFCSKSLPSDECRGLCAGNCGLQYPRK